MTLNPRRPALNGTAASLHQDPRGRFAASPVPLTAPAFRVGGSALSALGGRVGMRQRSKKWCHAFRSSPPCSAMQDFRKLLVWRRAHDLAVTTMSHTTRMPRGHAEMTSQLRRATASVGANISEGAQRPTNAQFAHFLGIALASLAEAHNHVLLMRDARLMQPTHAQDLLAQIDRLRPMLLNLQARVRTAGPRSGRNPAIHTHPGPPTHDPKPSTE